VPGVSLEDEFDRQVATLRATGYPALTQLAGEAFERLVAPLRARLSELELSVGDGRVPVVIVVSGELAPTDQAIALVDLGGKQGFTDMDAEDLRRFVPIEGVDVPDGPVYLIVDVDTGADTLSVTPDDAIDTIAGQGRSPLTIDEGLALATHHPELLRTRNCFSMLGSRCGDRRVTTIWLSKGRPRLGWCWAGAPHTWLGSASCGRRVGAKTAVPLP